MVSKMMDAVVVALIHAIWIPVVTLWLVHYLWFNIMGGPFLFGLV